MIDLPTLAWRTGRPRAQLAADLGVTLRMVASAKHNRAAVEAWRAQWEQDRAAARQEATP